MSAPHEDRYDARLGVTLLASVLLHVVVVLVLWWAPRPLGEAPVPEPLLLNLVPEQQPERQQLAPVAVPSDTAPLDAAHIAAFNAEAAGERLQAGAQPGPTVQQESAIERPGAAVAPPMPDAPPAPPAPPAPEESPQDAAPPPSDSEAPAAPEAFKAREVEAMESAPAPRKSDREAAVIAEQDSPAPKSSSKPERMQVAQAKPQAAPAAMQPVPPQPGQPERPGRGRLDNRVVKQGFSSYEALQDDIAPYLEEVKRRVEKYWVEALLLHYSGTQPREVEVDCEIAANGTLASVKLVAPSEDQAYGILCMNAIRAAAPFPRFPFQVPDLYRNQNLEIRWHFSFL